MDEKYEHIKLACESIERMFSCHICMHGRIGPLSFIPYYHLNRICTFLKRKNRLISNACYSFDAGSIWEKMQKEKRSFYKICPAGLWEAAVPVILQNWVVSSLFAGPFLVEEPPEGEKFTAKPFPLAPPGLPSIPRLTKSQAEDLLNLLLLLADRIADAFQDSLPQKKGFEETCRKFIETHYFLNIGLEDLCNEVKLSRSRVSAKLRETFGASFTQLLNEARIREAKVFLKNSSLSISEIAERCGYMDGKYFHRVFRKITGMTPKAFRKNEH